MLPANTKLGTINLAVKNLPLLRQFYRDILGLTILSETKNSITLGDGHVPLVTLNRDTTLNFAEAHSVGLYHTAFVFSHRSRLAATLLTVFQYARNLYLGSGDHHVSEAFYLSDPEGNGVELYFDRPGVAATEVMQQTEALDELAFMNSYLQGDGEGTIAMGHIHLKIGNIAQAKAFYVDILGFSTMMEMPTALFVSAGGYHHHLGLNTWESNGASARKPALGLQNFEIIVPDDAAYKALKNRLEKHTIEFAEKKDSLHFEDPWGIGIVARC